MWICPKCGKENEYAFCTGCGMKKPETSNDDRMSRTNDRVLKIMLVVIAVLTACLILFLCLLPVIRNAQLQTMNYESGEINEATPSPVPDETEVPVDYKKEIIAVYSRTLANGADEIVIETTSKIEPERSTYQNPARVAFDFKGFTLRDKRYSTGESGYNFKDIRKADHEDYARVVIDLTNSCTVGTVVEDNRCVITLTPKD